MAKRSLRKKGFVLVSATERPLGKKWNIGRSRKLSSNLVIYPQEDNRDQQWAMAITAQGLPSSKAQTSKVFIISQNIIMNRTPSVQIHKLIWRISHTNH